MSTRTNDRAEALLAEMMPPVRTVAWRMGGSLLLAAGLMVLAVGCTTGDDYAVAAQRASVRLGVDASELRVTRRSELSTDRHTVFRVTEREGERELVVAVPSDGHAVIDSSMPDAFVSLARAEDLGARFEQFGGPRVAGWFAAFGGDRCGEPLLTSLTSVGVVELEGDAHELRFAFASADGVDHCDLVLDGQGLVERSTVRSHAQLSQNDR